MYFLKTYHNLEEWVKYLWQLLYPENRCPPNDMDSPLHCSKLPQIHEIHWLWSKEYSLFVPSKSKNYRHKNIYFQSCMQQLKNQRRFFIKPHKQKVINCKNFQVNFGINENMRIKRVVYSLH